MLSAKTIKSEAITIPAQIAKKFSLKEGSIVEAKVEKGKLVILKKKNTTATIMQFAGMWENENVDKVFREIRKDWSRWQKNVSV
jgi:AbrB family looped-hinge helix DNA binding protein